MAGAAAAGATNAVCNTRSGCRQIKEFVVSVESTRWSMLQFQKTKKPTIKINILCVGSGYFRINYN